MNTRRSHGHRQIPRGMTLVEVLAVMAIVGLMMGLLMPAIQQSREASRAVVCRQNLKQIGLAAHAFHAAFRAFPPARIVPRPGDAQPHACGGQEPTWFVHLLPFLEEPAAARWNVYEPFAAHPDDLRAIPVSVYVCPTRRSLGQAAGGAKQAVASATPTGGPPRLAMMMLCPVCSGRPRPLPPVGDDPDVPGSAPPGNESPEDPGTAAGPPPNPVPAPNPSGTSSGALGDYAGNHGDLSPGATGAATDFYYGGNGTGILITSRARCLGGRPMEWIDRIRIHDVSDGLSNTFLAGERHVPLARLGVLPDDGSVYDGNSFHFASRVAGPGAQLARNLNDLTAGLYSFGSWHQDVCHFVMGDGSVRGVSDQISTTVLGSLSNRRDGNPVTGF
jgi:prepilin-type N-terminal cleavage/methylation domain-containing protein